MIREQPSRFIVRRSECSRSSAITPRSLACIARWGGRRSPHPTHERRRNRSCCAVHAYEGVGSARGIGQALLGLAAVEAAEDRSEKAVAIVAAAEAFLARAGAVVAHPMAPDLAERIEELKASIPTGTLERARGPGCHADGSGRFGNGRGVVELCRRPTLIGRTLAHYRITAALGAGGMGEVWRATDTKLDREVALKVLPEAFADDPDRLARFEREAKVLASLNHPNIAHLYGLESVNTQMAAGTAAPQESPRHLRRRLWGTRPACQLEVQAPSPSL